jgi:hypothetical protein
VVGDSTTVPDALKAAIALPIVKVPEPLKTPEKVRVFPAGAQTSPEVETASV